MKGKFALLQVFQHVTLPARRDTESLATLGYVAAFSRRSAVGTLVFCAQKPSLSVAEGTDADARKAYSTAAAAPTMLTDPGHAQPEPASPFPRQSPSGGAGFWKDNGADVAPLFFPANFLEPAASETFLELDPAGFFSSSGSATKGSCAAASGFGRRTPPPQPGFNCWTKLEPSREPCTDEIPWSDLVFWLGNASTGEVVCSCAQCARRAMRCSNGNLMRHRYSPYQQQQQQQQQHQRRVSSRVPVINLPRIEGVN
ncbi:uncharacterized protein IUM83_10799 [Phytophthora cinnamomi]|uniref:uncharacterized protein n=1 Tax=Phytophthora cinnamomi TaxID=4785 RepID=UPI003559AA62|nr:hypothetical protein IUM83_10799 [Phytophthora cinnamomi]